MNEQEQAQQMKKILKSFQRTFERYADEIASDYADDDTLRTLRKQLQRREPSITDTLIKVLGDGTLEERTTDGKIRYSISRRDLLGMILLEANTKNLEFFNDLVDFALREINRSLGNIENGLWPPKEKPPILIIKDAELRDRCAGLLSTSGKYDTVIREATTILENRIRSKAGHDLLARLIPNANDQTGENLVNQLFSPTKPILEVSSEKDKRISFHRILLGVVSYLRNPYHHKLDPSVEWSWAWSTVGLVDRLLLETDSCAVSDNTPPGRGSKK